MRVIGNKMYEVCGICGKIVCLNKFVFHSMHVCLSEEEQKLVQSSQQHRDLINAQIQASHKILYG